MAEFIKLSPDTLRQLRTVDELLVSYNVEMTEVTGGTFWKAYSPEEIAGTKPFEGSVGSLANHTAMAALMQFYPPIDLKSEKLRKLAKDIGPAWVRVSGTWSTKTYYDFDGKMGGKSPEGYTAANFVRDQDLFNRWLHENYPGCLAVGPCSTVGIIGEDGDNALGGGIADVMPSVSTDELMDGATEPMEVYSYHYYNGVSERLQSIMPMAHWSPEKAHTEEYLAVAPGMARSNAPLRDRYVPGGQMWVTESGDAGGGDTWASTYLDVLRTLNELGGFSAVTDGIIFHNTLASSDYGYLKPEVFDPRPNFFAVVLWNRLMGTTVYDAAEPIREGAHVYAHSRHDGKPGKAYPVINNSMTETTTVELPGKAEIYQLTAETPRASVMQCNGKALTLGEGYALPAMDPVAAEGTLTLPALSCTFIVTEG